MRHPPLSMLASGLGKKGAAAKSKGKAGGKGGGKAGTSKGGGGFGKPKKPAAVLDDDVAALLERANGNLDAAQAAFFQQSVMRLQQEEPELFEKMQQASVSMRSDEVHEKLVEMTWDTIAAFMPMAGGTPGEVKRKLRQVARAACDTSSRDGKKVSVLDVGCGDGAALPYLVAAGADEASYVGLDLSSRMIKAAQQAHSSGGAVFECGSFVGSSLAAPPSTYDTVLFNGALQFFTDQEDVLRRAAALVPNSGGRVVLAHVNGAAFVREEAAGNPNTVPSVMPDMDWLRRQALELGMAIIGPRALGIEGGVDEANLLESFYLVALERVG